MLFNSYEFLLVFLPLTLIIFYALAKFRSMAAKIFLIFASLCFYSYWDIRNLPVLLFSIFANYVCGYALSRKRSKKILLLGIAFNLFFLGYYKYTDFLISNVNLLFDSRLALQHIVLPLGISFFTFTQTAYLVDVYRGETREYTKSDYFLFVTIFPHLIAGPILYHKDMIPQFSQEERYKLDYKNMVHGIIWFVIGLVKKVIIADKLAVYANLAFNSVDKLKILDAWCGSLAYTLQLYFDFSGYSEMAIGLGLMFNFNLPLNFNLPYRACSIIDFWRRWHITLSAFLKNYLYIPLGGNRTGHHLRNILLTMFLGGLWHGAGWTFIFWGTLHGIFICANHLWRKTGCSLPRWLAWLLTFNAVNLAWIFFRADNFPQALKIIRAMGDLSSFALPSSIFLAKHLPFFEPGGTLLKATQVGTIFACLVISLLVLKKEYLEKINPYATAVLFALLALCCVLNFSSVTEFLYFQF